MANENKTEIMVILDKSGSMSASEEFIVSSFNEFIQSQREVEGECTVSLILFDDKYHPQYLAKPIADVTELTVKEYSPSGMTAMNDAIGKGINDLGQKINELPESDRPGKVVVAIFTDGYENSSVEYDNPGIKKLMDTKKNDHKWEFVILGTPNLDMAAEASARGMVKGSSLTLNGTDEKAYSDAFVTLSATTAQYRSGNRPTMSFDDK